MRLLVTGASSFVGAHVCLLARDQGHQVYGVHWSTAMTLPGIRAARIDLSQESAAKDLAALPQPDAVLHLACKVMGTGDGSKRTPAMELDRKMMDRVLEMGLPTIYASSTCVHWDGTSGYAEQRREDEDRLASSGLPWATLRPSAPFGARLVGHTPGHAESFHTLADMVAKSPVVPMVGRGTAMRQPIHVDDFGGAMLALLEQGPLPDQAFDAGGAEALPFKEIVRRIGHHLDTHRLRVPVPLRLLTLAARLRPDMDADLLSTADQDDLADPAALEAATGLSMRGFDPAVLFEQRK